MKKIFAIAMLFAAVSMVSCGGNGNKKKADKCCEQTECCEQADGECCGCCEKAEGECCGECAEGEAPATEAAAE